jgi:hypothetical protein
MSTDVVASYGAEENTQDIKEEPVWLQNIHKVLPDWDPREDTPIPDWAKPEWAVSPHGNPTEVSLRGPYSDNVEWLNASYVFSPIYDCSDAIIIDHTQGNQPIIYTWDNLTLHPNKTMVNQILEDRSIYGSYAWNYTEYVEWYNTLSPEQIERNLVTPPEGVFPEQVFESQKAYLEWYKTLTPEYIRDYGIRPPEVVCFD